MLIDDIIIHISKNNDTKIVLLRIPEVIKWIFGDTSFITTDNKKSNYKTLEDMWGKGVLSLVRSTHLPPLNKQQTNTFGEYLCDEIYTLFKKDINVPEQKNKYRPDREINDAIIEVKTQTYYTSGTAGEKILGVPFKYCEIPRLYSKKLIILCIGGAEHKCIKDYGNLPGKS